MSEALTADELWLLRLAAAKEYLAWSHHEWESSGSTRAARLLKMRLVTDVEVHGCHKRGSPGWYPGITITFAGRAALFPAPTDRGAER